MKKFNFKQAEEKYIFGLSKVVWRTVTLLLVLVLTVSLIVLISSIIPPMKKKVIKAEYPPEVPVTTADIEKAMQETKKVKKTERFDVGNFVSSEAEKDKVSPAEVKAFEASLLKFKAIVEAAGFSWEEEGYYEYPYGYAWYEYYGESYRKYVISSYGISKLLIEAFDESNIYELGQKKLIVDNYIAFLNQCGKDKHNLLINSLKFFISNDYSQSIGRLAMFRKVMSKFDSVSFDAALYRSAEFVSYNPENGIKFMVMADTMLPKFNISERLPVYNCMIWGNEYLDGRLEYQAYLTSSFLKMKDKLPNKPTDSLMYHYYTLSVRKNIERQIVIDSIDYEYGNQVITAESEYIHKKNKDKQNLIKSGYGVVGSILLIAIIALTLVFFSIHKYLKKVNQLLEVLVKSKVKEEEFV